MKIVPLNRFGQKATAKTKKFEAELAVTNAKPAAKDTAQHRQEGKSIRVTNDKAGFKIGLTVNKPAAAQGAWAKKADGRARDLGKGAGSGKFCYTAGTAARFG
jgi:hypothetical protein